ncbi:MAG: FixH family protein, partial [Candidatus Aenigmarchaeota archaeon]|nr:FixH family protein [Candidatus Aenigmarchaeota archaeon]
MANSHPAMTSQSRPAEFIIIMLFLLFFSTLAVAQQQSQKVVVETKDITVFADTSVGAAYDAAAGEIRAVLTMDDGTPLEGMLVEFHVNGQPAGVAFTDENGAAALAAEIEESDDVAALFGGDESAYLNPSEVSVQNNQTIGQRDATQALNGKPQIRLIGRKTYALGETVEIGIDAVDGNSNPAVPSHTEAYLIDAEGNEKQLAADNAGGKDIVRLETQRSYRPGSYTLRAISTFGSQVAEAEENITIGLVNVNTDKGIYRPGENATVTVGVLDLGGSPIAGADVRVSITDPQGDMTPFSTSSGTVTDNGDGTYTFHYTVKEIGTYEIHAEVTNLGYTSTYDTNFDVRSFVEFDIVREAPTIIKLEPTSITINITSNVRADSATITEYLPSEFNVTTSGFVSDNGTVKTITWHLGDLDPGETATVEYTFEPPHISPALYLLGPARIDYNHVQSFSEGRAWTLAADAAFFYYVKWQFNWNGSVLNVSDQMTLCRDQPYNISIVHFDLAHDSDSTSQTVRLQVKPEGEAVFQSLPYAGFNYWNGQANDVTLASELGNDNVDCDAGVDHCYLANRSVNITDTTATKKYSLKYTSQQFPGRFLDNSNVIGIRVINCTDVNLVRDIKVYSAAGEDGYVVKGHRASIVVPLANYNTSQYRAANISVYLLDGTTPLSWFLQDNQTQPVTIDQAATQPNYNENALLWRFDVPDSATQKTYTAKVQIKHNGTGYNEINYTKDFTLQDSGDGTAQPLVIYTAPAFVTPCDGTSSSEHFKLQVCNYGDYNLTANISLFITGKNGLSNSTVIEGEGNDSLDSDTIIWNNREIATSTCFMSAARVFGPEDVNVPGSYLTDVVWIDPVTGIQQGVSKADSTGTCGGAVNNAHGGSPNPVLNVTTVSAGTLMNLQFSERSATTDGGESVYLVDMTIPAGINVTRANFSRAPDLGYPVGSIVEGYKVRWTFSPTPLTMITTVNGLTDLTNITSTVGDIGNFTPGGKVFYQSLVGQSSVNKGQWWTKQRVTLQVNGTWLKTTRKYLNNTEGQWKEYDFPTALSCGTVNASLEAFNKGNANGTRFNVTEIYPSGIGAQDFTPANSSGSTTVIIWDGNRNFTIPTGRLVAKIFNYTINLSPSTPTGKMGVFQANHTNATYVFTDRTYTTGLFCGASLSMASITSSSSANQSVNISMYTTVTNGGPGSASNVTVEINSTGNFTVYNSTGHISNKTYLGTLANFSSGIANYTINTTAPCGSTYTFWMNATSGENATPVVQSTTLQVLCPAKSIFLDNPKVNSTETNLTYGGWGFNFTFNITVDSDADSSVNISAWRSTDQSNWLFIDDDLFLTTDSLKNFSFVWDPGSDDIGTWFFKFNATDGGGNTNTTTARSFSVDKENTSITSLAPTGLVANRSANQTTQIGFIINDKNGTILQSFGVKFHVTTNNVTYYTDSRYINATNSTGHAVFNFNATCADEYSGAPRFQVGEQQWKITFNDTVTGIYNDNDTSSYFIRNITVRGDQRINITDPTGAVNFTQRDVIDTIGTVFDDCSLELGGATVNYTYNYTPAQIFNCTTINSPVTGLYRCSWDSSVGPAGYYNVTMNSNLSNYYDNFTIKSKTTEAGLFFLNIYKNLQNITATPSTDGWGRPEWNFSVLATSGNATPTFNVNFSMKTASGSFVDCLGGPLSSCANATPTTCTGCSQQQYTFLRNFTNSQQGTWFIKFALNTTESSGTDTITVEKDDINIGLYSTTNNSIANRTGSNTTRMAVFVYDIDAGANISTPSVSVTFNVTNVTSFITTGSNTTNTSSVAEFYFNPNCSFEVGQQNWLGLTSGDSNYKDNQSVNFSLNISGSFAPAIPFPNGDSFTQGNNVSINVSVVSDCTQEINNAAINVTMTSTVTGDNFNCAAPNVTSLGSGNYSCVWNSTGASTGFYNVTVQVFNVSNYNNRTIFKANTFRLLAQNNTAPDFRAINNAPSTGGFGEMFNFSVEARDTDSDDVNVTFYLSPDNTTFTLIEWKTCAACGSYTNVTFNYTQFTCSNITTQYFRFNLSDGQLSNQTPSTPFTVEKDDVTVYLIQGNGVEVNRTGSNSTLLVLRINDTDKGVNVSSSVNTTMYFTTNLTAFGEGNVSLTNGSGHFNLSFDPNCGVAVGAQVWKGGVRTDACYKDTNSSNQSITVIGRLSNSLKVPLNGVHFQNGQNVTFLGDVTDDCSVFISGSTIYFISSHDAARNLSVPSPAFNIGNGSYNGTLNVTNLTGGFFNVTFNSSGTNYNPDNVTTLNAYFYQINPLIFGAASNVSSAPWGATFSFTVNVTDDDDNLTLRLWDSPDNSAFTQRSLQTCTDCVNSTVTFTRTYSVCTDIDETWYWKVNVTDSDNLTNETSVQTINVTRRNVNFVHQAGNNTNVSRVGSNTTTLTVRIRDNFTGADIGSGFDGAFFVTVNGSLFSRIAGPATDPNSDISTNFNPSCSPTKFEVGNQKWIAEFRDTGTNNCYFPANSSNLTLQVQSEFVTNVTNPNGEAFQRGSAIQIRGTANDRDSACGGTTAATVIYKIIQGGTTNSCSPEPASDLNNGTYNCSWDSTSQSLGFWNITMNTTANFHNSSFITRENALQLRERPQLTLNNVNVSVAGWGENITFNVTVRDPDSGDSVNVTLWRSFDGNSYTPVDSQTCSSCTSETNLNFYKMFVCGDFTSGPLIYFKFNATDSYSLTNETSVKNWTTERDDVAVTLITGSGVTINRTGSSTSLFSVRIRDTDNGSFLADNGNGSIWVTTNGVNFDAGTQNFTNATGHLNLYFDPTCSYAAGTELWRGGTNQDACYKDANLSSSQTFTVLGQLKVNLLQPAALSTFNVTNQVVTNFTIPTDCSVDGNLTGVTNLADHVHVNGSTFACSPITEISSHYNCTLNSTGKPEGNYSINISATLTSYNSNLTNFSVRYFLDNLAPQVNTTNALVNPTSGSWSRDFNYTITANDTENDTITCTLYV